MSQHGCVTGPSWPPPALLIADSPQVSHFPPLCLCFCTLTYLSPLMTLWAFAENDCFPLLRWLCDGSPVLEGSSKPYVIHAIKKMQTPECGTGPWEAFPTLLIMMTGICFLHRRATSMQVDKIQTGNNKCNNNNNKSKGSCCEKKKKTGHLHCSSPPTQELHSSLATDMHHRAPAG